MSKEELEKLEREKYVVERKLTAAMHKEKRLQSELKRLTRSERTHRLCTRAGMLETFLKEPTTLTDDDVMLKKIVLFPISLFVAFLALMARWLLTLSSYVVAPLMLYIFGCGIYTAYRQTWDQFLILLVAEFICFILFFGATAITEGIGRFSEWLAEL